MKKDNTVFIVSLVIVLAIVGFGLLVPETFSEVAGGVFSFLVGNFGWFYMITMTAFVVFSIWIAFSKYGKIKLGKDDSKPEFSLFSWFGMLFSAGMGVGLIFWGVAEPLNHFVWPIGGIEPGSVEAANFAMSKSFLHWGLHPWAAYSVLALALAYMQFRKGKPGLVSSIFIPLIGEERARGPIGKAIDILAVFATVTGVATSLGMATLQTTSGLGHLFGAPETDLTRIIVITVITILFIFSAVTGIDKGIKWLSNINVTLCGVLVVLVLILGPTVLILNNLTLNIGSYFQNIINQSFTINVFEDTLWYGWWTIFYWAWWIAWAPFVGTFIARISKGRTIKEFVLGVLFAPSFVGFIWFSVFGTVAISQGLEFGEAAAAVTETAYFVVMEQLPLGTFISLITVVLLTTFFVTSADSATFVLGMLTSGGDLNPSVKRKVTWGLIQSALALSLMLASADALGMLQTASIAAAFPFAFVMIFGMISLVKALRKDVRGEPMVEGAVEETTATETVINTDGAQFEG